MPETGFVYSLQFVWPRALTEDEARKLQVIVCRALSGFDPDAVQVNGLARRSDFVSVDCDEPENEATPLPAANR